MASIQRRQGTRGTTYRVMWRTPEGAQRSRTLADAAAARKLCAEMALAEQRGRGPDPRAGDITLAEWAADVIGAKPLKPKTEATYDELLRTRILPTFGHLRLRDIDRAAIRHWVAGLAGEVSARRTQNAFALLRHLLAEAVIEERIEKNPADRVSLPRATSPELRPWTIDELVAVETAAGRYGPLILWLGLMGTRWAETIGLRWSDIEDVSVTIASTLSEVRGRHHRVPTKTFAHRTLVVPSALLSKLGPPGGAKDLVFASAKGAPLRSGHFKERVFIPACRRAGVPPIRVHHLRHTSASLLIAAGASPKAVQNWLGHADVRVTLNTYTHWYATDRAELAASMTALLESTQPEKAQVSSLEPAELGLNRVAGPPRDCALPLQARGQLGRVDGDKF